MKNEGKRPSGAATPPPFLSSSSLAQQPNFADSFDLTVLHPDHRSHPIEDLIIPSRIDNDRTHNQDLRRGGCQKKMITLQVPDEGKKALKNLSKMVRIANADEKYVVPKEIRSDVTRRSVDPIEIAVKTAYEKFKDCSEGAVATYIPALARADPNLFGIAVMTASGKLYTAGDCKSEVSMQSVSKVFTLALVLEQHGPQIIIDNLGVVATGQSFNSIKAIEEHQGLGMNPCVNAGAIATCSYVNGNKDEALQSIFNFFSEVAGREVKMNEEVYRSESDHGDRNRAVALLMSTYGRLKRNALEAADIYTRQCAASVNAADLACMCACLATGANPITGKPLISHYNIPKILAVMATAGLYDDSGQWLFQCGLPAKSGVGGAIIAVCPGRFGIAAISPKLDPAGNSCRAAKAITYITNLLECNPYAPKLGLIMTNAQMQHLDPFDRSTSPQPPSAAESPKQTPTEIDHSKVPEGVRHLFDKFKEKDKPHITTLSLRSLMTDLGESLNVREVTEFFQAADLDGDGKISYEDLLRFLMQHNVIGPK